MKRIVTLPRALRLLSLFFFWYLVVFVLSILPLVGVQIPPILQPEYRGTAYAWDFELMFTAIFVVWGFFLWKAAEKPEENRSFISFTIYATIAHIAAMLVIGIVRTADFIHLLVDAVALSVPLALVMYVRK